MSILSIISTVIGLVQTLIRWGSERNLLNAGAKSAIADQLLKTSRMVADAKKIEEWVATQPDVNIDSILSDHYTKR